MRLQRRKTFRFLRWRSVPSDLAKQSLGLPLDRKDTQFLVSGVGKGGNWKLPYETYGYAKLLQETGNWLEAVPAARSAPATGRLFWRTA